MNKQDLIDLIISKIYSNIDNEISGDILQRVLIEIVNDCYETNDVFVTSVNYSAATTTLTVVMSNGTYSTYKIDIPNPVTIVQSEGQSTEYVMSQKAVTDVFKAIRKSIEDNLLLKVDKTTKINGHTLDKDVELTPDDIGAASKEELKEKITNFKGYWTSKESLESMYKAEDRYAGWFAWVGTPYPGVVHTIFIDEGEWISTGEVPPVSSVDLREYTKTTDDYGTVIRDGELAQETGNRRDKAISQRIFTELINKRANGGYFKSGLLFLTCDGIEVGSPIELGGLGIINVTDDNDNRTFDTPNDARSLVSVDDRILGQIISYRLTTGWVLEMFNGDHNQVWLEDEQWKQYITKDVLDQVSASLEDLRGQVEGLAEDIKLKIDDGFIEEEDEETAYLVLTSNGEEMTRIQLPAIGGGGGGGGTGVTMKLRAIGGTTIVAGDGTDAVIRWDFTSIDNEDQSPTGDGTITITVNNVTVHSGVVSQGTGSFNVRDYVSLGRNNVRLRIVDSYANSRSISYTVQKASLVLSSPFSGTLYETSPIAFRYTITGAGEKTIRFWLNGTELDSDTVSSSGIQITKQLTGMKEGINNLRVKATSLIDGVIISSNELYYEFIYATSGVGSPIIVSSFNRDTVKQFETIKVPFFAYDPYNDLATVFIYVDNTLVESMQVPRTTQEWEYRVTQSNNMVLELRCGSSNRIFNLTVEKSDSGIEEVTSDLEFKVQASGKSNSSANRDEWAYGSYSTVFSGFNWQDTGWIKDAQNNTALRLTGDAKATINIRPFNAQVLSEGMTYTIEYSTSDVADDNAVIIEQFINGIGIKLTPTSVFINSVETGLVSYLDSSEKVSISFVVEKRSGQRLLGIYINGIFSRSIQYSNSDNFNQQTTDLKITTGERKAIVNVYNIRWYRNNLEDSQVLANYIYDTENSVLQEQIYNRNDIIDAYNNIDYTRAINFIPCMKIIGDLPTYKGDKKTNTIVFENLQRPNKSFTAEDVTNDVQGTSSQFYPRKNFKFKLNKDKGMILSDSGETVFSYALDDNTLPANVFCTKADFAESSGTHNTGLAIVVQEILNSVGIKVPEQISEPKVRTTIFGYPILIFHQATITSEPIFIGKYNFNYDKAAENTFGFDTGCESWEFKDNTSNLCLFKGADFDSTFINDKGESIYEWTNHLEARYPDGSDNVSNVRQVFEWVVSCTDNPTKFKAELENWFDLDNLLSYWVMTELYACTDQRAKNQFLTKYKDGKWRFIFYDNDTILGIDNIGTIKFRYDVETEDVIDNGHVFNGWNSNLWTLFKATYWSEINSMYDRLRLGKMTYNYSMQVFQDHQAAQWAERIYNKDGYFKYVEPLVTTGENYLAELQGSRTTHRIWWLKNRFNYMDSRFKTGNYKNDFVSLRLYTPTSWSVIAPNANFTLMTNKAGYVHIRFGQSDSDQVRTKANTSFTINAPTGMQFNDTETIIYGASTLKDLGDLSSKYLGLVDVTSATRLERLIIGNTNSNYKNQNFKNLSLGNNTMLREVNIANCPNFGNLDAGSSSTNLDLSKATTLETFNAYNTALRSVELPESGILKTLSMPATITTLILKGQVRLTSLVVQGYTNISTLIVDNTPNIDGYSIARSCINTGSTKLSKVRLMNIDTSDTDSKVLNYLSLIAGDDGQGNQVNTAVVTGKITISQMTQTALDRLSITFPNLVITVLQLVDKLEFEDPIVETIMVDHYDTNGDGELSASEVSDKVITSGLLTGTGARRFNEARYWTGKTSIIDNCNTLAEVSINSDSHVITGLSALSKVTLFQGATDINNMEPLFGSNVMRDCYSINRLVLSGRYKESASKGVILGQWSHPQMGVINSMCLILRGFPILKVDEPCVMTDAFVRREQTYNWGNAVTTMEFGHLYSSVVRFFPNLETFNVTGLGNYQDINIMLYGELFKLKYINIRDDKQVGGIITNLQLNGIGSYNQKFNSLIKVTVHDNVEGLIANFDSNRDWIGAAGNIVFDFGKKFKILKWSALYGREEKHTYVYRCDNIPICNISYNAFRALYVPDDKVDEWKTTTGWVNFASVIRPISEYVE